MCSMVLNDMSQSYDHKRIETSNPLNNDNVINYLSLSIKQLLEMTLKANSKPTSRNEKIRSIRAFNSNVRQNKVFVFIFANSI